MTEVGYTNGPDRLPDRLTPEQRDRFGPADYAQWVLDVVEAHPDWHDQDGFRRADYASSCGTTMCVAGWINYAVGSPRCDDVESAAVKLGLSVRGWYKGPRRGSVPSVAYPLFYSDNRSAAAALRRIAAGHQPEA